MVTKVLTRRPVDSLTHIPSKKVTHEIDELLEDADLIFEASGDPIHATPLVERAFEASLPVVTLNPELHVTTGSFLASKGYLTEAEGDQPGCSAALKRDAEAMTFRPLAYLNIKGYYNANPPMEEMRYWADKQGISLEQVTAFTDGGKLQIEQALVANGLNATIIRDGLVGGDVTDLKNTSHFATKARELGKPVSDYVVCPGAPKGVLILATSDVAEDYKHYPLASICTEEGNAFMLLQPHHLCHLEILKTIREVFRGSPPLLNNGIAPTIGVAAVAKRGIQAGETIERGLGGFAVRGEAIRRKEHPNHVPICLLQQATIIRTINEGEVIQFGHVSLPESRALEIVQQGRDFQKARAVDLV